MTRRERVICALNHRQPDHIPYNIIWTEQEREKMANFYGDFDFDEKIGNCIAMASDDCEFESAGNECYRDIFGIVWDRSGVDKDIGVIKNLVLPEPDLSGFFLPSVNEKLLRKNYEKLMCEKKNGKFAFGSIGFSMFERAWTLCGMENTLMYMLCEKEFLHDLLDMICERNLKIIEIGLEYDIDGFHFGDDWGQQKGMIMGAPLWREFIKPRMKRMYEKVKERGLYVSQHSCGDIQTVFDDIVEIGLDCYQTFQPEIYDIKACKKAYGDKLTFWGGISTQQLLASASPDKVESEIRRITAILNQNGGYILSPTHAVEVDVPAENMDRFIQVAKSL